MSVIDELIEDGYLSPPLASHFIVKLIGERWHLYEFTRSGWQLLFSNSNKETVLKIMQEQTYTYFFDSQAKLLD